MVEMTSPQFFVVFRNKARTLAALITVFALWATAAWAGVNEDFLEAAKRGDLAAVKGFLAKGADVNAKVNEGRTALILASERGYIEVVRVLLAKGANVNAKYNLGSTALMAASFNGYIEIVRALIDKGADLNVRDSLTGTTAAGLAVSKNHKEVFQLLVSRGGHL